MPRICILTDSTAQFTRQSYPGQDLVLTIPHAIKAGDRVFLDGKDLSVLKAFSQRKDGEQPIAQAPSVELFGKTFADLSTKYREIVVILTSSHLSHAFANAQQASEEMKSPAAIQIIDSQTTAAGLGLLVQAAAEAAVRGTNGATITRMVRGLARHIYSAFCLPDLSHLERSGQIDPAQAFVGEMLGVVPLYVMENGQLAHVQKIRSSRHLVDVLFEFAAEFDEIKYLALIQGLPSFEQEGRNLRERIMQNLRSTPIGEHTLGLALATILGPHAMGLIAMENKDWD